MKSAVRGFHLRDLEPVAELERLCNPLPWTREDLRTFIESSSGNFRRVARVAVVKEDVQAGETEEVVGYVCAQVTGEEAEILIFGVAPTSRRQGIGLSLLQDLRATLKTLGCKKVFLEVRDRNAAALSLYASVGFMETHIRKNYYADTREDARVMQWDLTG